MSVVLATRADMAAWLALAAEVEPLFGPLVGDPGFQRALAKHIERGSALCVRAAGEPPGSPLLGGLLFAAHPPLYKIGWLAVAQHCRRQGLGQQLVEYALRDVRPPAEIVVTTFGHEHPGGPAARRFYERLGFVPAEDAPPGPEGGSRQLYRRRLELGATALL